jgi:hypothetical protein
MCNWHRHLQIVLTRPKLSFARERQIPALLLLQHALLLPLVLCLYDILADRVELHARVTVGSLLAPVPVGLRRTKRARTGSASGLAFLFRQAGRRQAATLGI